MKRIVSGMIITLLLAGMLTFISDVQLARTERVTDQTMATITIIQPNSTQGKDAWIYERDANRTGDDWEMLIGRDMMIGEIGHQGEKLLHGLIQFNLSDIPSNAIIKNATLCLHQNGYGGVGSLIATVHRVLDYWNESCVTWNERTVGQTWNSSGGDYDLKEEDTKWLGTYTQDEFNAFNVTSLVQQWMNGTHPNYGMLLRGSGQIEIRLTTSDHHVYYVRPYLEIQYTRRIQVPDDYPTIQAAINAASNGDTVFVTNGTYYEHVKVNKSIALIGENKGNTIIDGSGTGNVVYVTSNDVKISGFMIRSGDYGVWFYRSNNSTVTDNVMISNYYGILSTQSDSNTIRENVVLHCTIGIELRSRNSTIVNNTISSGGSFALFLYGGGNNSVINNTIAFNPLYGIYILDSSGNIFRNNKMTGNLYNFGVYSDYNIGLLGYIQDIDTSNLVEGKPIYYLINQENIAVDPISFPEIGYLGIVNSTHVTVKDLNLMNNMQGMLLAYTTNSTVENVTVSNIGSYGIHFDHSIYNEILSCELTDSSSGIYLSFSNSNVVRNDLMQGNLDSIRLSMSSSNRIYHNSFINNTRGVHLKIVHPFYNDTSLEDTIWNNGCEGNYWSDYNGTDSDADGIGDTPYIINGNNTDRYPLMNPYWLPGDVNHDLKIDIYDVVRITGVYNSEQEDSNWNCHSDIAEPYGIINIHDVVTCTKDYRKEYTP